MSEEALANDVVHILCEQGHDAHIVGGAARDLMRGYIPNDYDIASDCPPEDVAIYFGSLGYKVSIHGASFKTCTVTKDGHTVDVSQYRQDCYTDDGMCKPKSVKTLNEDLCRRDFTINSMALCPYRGERIDPFKGMYDLDHMIIRFVGDPKLRIIEDPDRILRAFVLRAMFGKESRFADETWEALKTHAVMVLDQVVPERIQKEIYRALRYPDASLFFEGLHHIGILKDILPSLEACWDLNGGRYHDETVWEHSMIAGDFLSSEDDLLKLAGYLHDVGKAPAAESWRQPEDGVSDEVNEDFCFHRHEQMSYDLIRTDLKKLKFSKDAINKVASLSRLHMRSVKPKITDKAVRRLLAKFEHYGIDWRDWLRLKVADRKGNLLRPDYTKEEYNMMEERILKWLNREIPMKVTDLMVSGQDVMNILEIGPGPEVGKTMNMLLDAVMADPELNNPVSLAVFLKEVKNERQSAKGDIHVNW